MSRRPPSPAPIDKAIAWAVRLASGSATEQDRAHCQAWRAAAPAHEEAWSHVQALDASFDAIPRDQTGLAAEALRDAAPLQAAGRRRVLQRLGTGALSLLVGALLLRAGPSWQTQRLATAVGVRHRTHLGDGTVLQLNTASDVGVKLTPLRRLIILYDGEVYIDTGDDALSPVGRRPFWVHTRHARLEALGTRFGVLQRDEETVVYVNDGNVAIYPPDDNAMQDPAPQIIVRPGERYVIRNGVDAPARLDDASWTPNAWTDGVLLAKRMRLDDFIAELARYHPRPIRCHPDVANLRVSGVFQLAGSHIVDRAIEALTRSLPLRVANEPGHSLTLMPAR